MVPLHVLNLCNVACGPGHISFIVFFTVCLGSVFKATIGVMTVLPTLQVKTAQQGSRLYEFFLLLHINRILNNYWIFARVLLEQVEA